MGSDIEKVGSGALRRRGYSGRFGGRVKGVKETVEKGCSLCAGEQRLGIGFGDGV